MRRIFSFLKLFRKDLLVMLLALFHRDTPKRIRVLLVLALLYLLSPVDLIPEAIPFAGMLDDMVVVPAAVCGLENLLPAHVRAAAEARAEKTARVLPVVAVLASVFVLGWAVLLLYGLVQLIF